jgi:hypothetical protein
MKHVDLLEKTHEKRFVIDVRRSVLLLFILAGVLVVIQLILGARFIWSCAIIRRVHRVRCVVDQQIVETEMEKEPKKPEKMRSEIVRGENAMKWHFVSCP